MRPENIAVKERFQKAVYSDDWASVPDCLHPEFVLLEPASLVYGGAHHGFEGFLNAWRSIRATMQTLSIDVTHTYFTEDPDRMVTEMEYQGKVIASGVIVTSTVFERWVFRDGKILSIAPHWLDPPVQKPV